MDKVIDEDYHSSEDEDYKPPADAPENENDAFLIKNEEETKKSSLPTQSIDDLWADFIKPATSTKHETETVGTKPTPTSTPATDTTTSVGTKRKVPTSSGLDSAINMMKRMKKTSVLEKSQKDWNKFVTDKSIKEELDSHNRSQNSYLDKQNFLAKTDYNKFVKEKESREMARKPT